MGRLRQNIGLTIAISAFILLDLGTLAFGYFISHQVAQDAVAINLAGRQRMLSQRTTKAAILANLPLLPAEERNSAAKEAKQAYKMFRSTLMAFAQGGAAQGGSGNTVLLEAVHDRAAWLVEEVKKTIAPWPEAPDSGPEMLQFANFMITHNLDILDAMNQLTTELERQSVAEVSRLRIAQTLAFALSLINFFGILWNLHKQRQRAERDARTDTLTGLLNRSGIYQSLDAKIQAAQASHTPAFASLGIMLLDLDGFKQINDEFGHAAGDATLVEVARRLNTWKSAACDCGRLGGDEFVVICAGLDAASTQQAAADLSQILAGIPAGETICSATVGWATWTLGQSADSLISAADDKMYAGKAKKYPPRNHRTHQRELPAAQIEV